MGGGNAAVYSTSFETLKAQTNMQPSRDQIDQQRAEQQPEPEAPVEPDAQEAPVEPDAQEAPVEPDDQSVNMPTQQPTPSAPPRKPHEASDWVPDGCSLGQNQAPENKPQLLINEAVGATAQPTHGSGTGPAAQTTSGGRAGQGVTPPALCAAGQLLQGECAEENVARF